MNQPHRPFFVLGTVALLGIALTACGGSDSTEDTAASATNANGTIAASCVGDVTTAQVSSAGCIANLGGSTETLVCTGANTVYRLAGANHTREEVLQSNNSYSAGGTITINGVKIQCVS